MVNHLFFWAQLFGMHAIGVENVHRPEAFCVSSLGPSPLSLA
jgi:hypothetical protein